MRQVFDWDCGYICLLHHGAGVSYPRESKNLTVPLTAEQMLRILGDNWESSFVLGGNLEEDGIYMLSGLYRHWISVLDGKALDPADGEFYGIPIIIDKYAKNDSWALVKLTRRN